ncbi:major facilitator superfamily MFS_1 [Paenibacillus curdlanolyticus YK9]|uniref:Major facilitator superfamily MFS_1 n=1 Tax=Paenibacillus curdlanolyticus YK9 TaxID=717606 RepID=E0IAS9_9BACL|nr:MFS transporter [Paenibacillus curdlanolyticus]EFM10483.1 major facilitator superfamily MFS_1 [Paenibacillus curdlanolyticus YK9]
MFRNPIVRTVMMSRVLQQLGVWVRNFAILLYVTEQTNNNPTYVSLISIAEFAPIFLFAFIGGAFADRWRPRRTMVGSDILSAVSAGIVLAVVAMGSWQALFAATFVSAMLSQFSQPSAMKLFKRHIPEDQLQGVMAMFQTLMAVFMVVGPIIGAFVYGQFGIEVSIGVMGVLMLGSAVLLLALPADPVPEHGDAPKGDLRQQLKEGFQYVSRNRLLRTLGVTFTVSGLAAGLIQPLALFVTIDNLGKDADFLQWLLMVNGAAMFIGGGLVMAMAKKIPPQLLLASGLFVSAFGTVAIGASTSLPLTIGLQVVTGIFYPCIHIGIQTLILKNTEGAYIGRVGGVLTPMFMGMMVIGMSVGGPLMHALSLLSVYEISGVLFLAGALLMIMPRVGRRQQLGIDK